MRNREVITVGKHRYNRKFLNYVKREDKDVLKREYAAEKMKRRKTN